MAADTNSTRRRVIRPLFIVAFVAAFLTINAFWPKGRPSVGPDGKLHVLCTFLPMYVFAVNVVGDTPGVQVDLLIDRNVGCPHSYSVSGQDLKKVSGADVIVANGLGIEPFLDELLRGQDRTRVLTISDECDVIRIKSGEHDSHEAQEADDHNAHESKSHEHGEGETHEHHETGHPHEHLHAGDVNPHTWVSPRQAAVQVRTLARKLSGVDKAHAEQYRANGEAYAKRLEALADRMVEVSKSFTNRNIVTGHAAFDYLARDLGLNVVATLQVVPGETASAGEMARVVDTIRNTHAAAVFWEPPFTDKTAETIARDAGVAVYPLNPFNTDAGLGASKSADGIRQMYEEVMNQNLATLQKALQSPATGAGH